MTQKYSPAARNSLTSEKDPPHFKRWQHSLSQKIPERSFGMCGDHIPVVVAQERHGLPEGGWVILEGGVANLHALDDLLENGLFFLLLVPHRVEGARAFVRWFRQVERTLVRGPHHPLRSLFSASLRKKSSGLQDPPSMEALSLAPKKYSGVKDRPTGQLGWHHPRMTLGESIKRMASRIFVHVDTCISPHLERKDAVRDVPRRLPMVKDAFDLFF